MHDKCHKEKCTLASKQIFLRNDCGEYNNNSLFFFLYSLLMAFAAYTRVYDTVDCFTWIL